MTSRRSYRDALDRDVVIEEFEKARGPQFDPEFVDPGAGCLENACGGAAVIFRLIFQKEGAFVFLELADELGRISCGLFQGHAFFQHDDPNDDGK